MVTVFGVIAAVSLVLSLGSTLAALWIPTAVDFDQALRLSSLLLSWKVITGALVTGTTVAFATEIRSMLKRSE